MLTSTCLSVCSRDWADGVQRLVAHAEEVAYNDPPSGLAERLILNQHLFRLLRHNRLSAFQRFVQQVLIPLPTLYAVLSQCKGIVMVLSRVSMSIISCSHIRCPGIQ